MELVIDVGGIGPSPGGITVGQLIDSVQSLPGDVEATVNVIVTQNWVVEFEEGSALDGFDKLSTVCKDIYPSCTGKIVLSPDRLRRALGSIRTAAFTRPLSNPSEPITMIPQLVADGVNVTMSTFVSTTAGLSVTAPGDAADANALSEGKLSPGEVTAAMSASLGLDEIVLSVGVPQPIFPPMPPPSLPPSPTPPSPSPSTPASYTSTLTSTASLRTAVQAVNANLTSAIATDGPVADWDVSGVSDMSWLFYELKNFNEDVSSWDTSSVTDMSFMFAVRSAHALAPQHSQPDPLAVHAARALLPAYALPAPRPHLAPHRTPSSRLGSTRLRSTSR